MIPEVLVCRTSIAKNNSPCPRVMPRPLASALETAKAEQAFTRPGIPADRRQVLAAQCRLLAIRAEAGLPVDLRSLRNLVVVFFQGMAS
jgi:hypothetical protein